MAIIRCLEAACEPISFQEGLKVEARDWASQQSGIIIVRLDIVGIWTGPGDFYINFAVYGVQDLCHCIRLARASNLPHSLLNTIEYGPQHGLGFFWGKTFRPFGICL